jgi:DNA replication protein DnaC
MDPRARASARSVVGLRNNCNNRREHVRKKNLIYISKHHAKRKPRQHPTARAYARLQGSRGRAALASRMSAFLKIDRCGACARELPWEWVAPVLLRGQPLAGTGVWHSTLIDGICSRCAEATKSARLRQRESERLRDHMIRLFGGVKPYREFTFERFEVTPGNHIAYEKARAFDPEKGSLYLWGPSGVGKTHLAFAVGRRALCRKQSVEIITAPKLIRKLRMRAPEEEQRGIDAFIHAGVLVLDDFGQGSDTAYSRQVLQEILDGRHFNDRGGLVVTSPFSLNMWVRRLADRAIPSRLAGMCQAIEIQGTDYRARVITRR